MNPIATPSTTPHRYAARIAGRVVAVTPPALADAAAFDVAVHATRHLPPHRRIGRWADDG